MLIIKHRTNTIAKVKNTPHEFGLEIDLRSNLKKIIVNHEPLKPSISFESLLRHYKHKFLIANIKEEGIEDKVVKILKKNNIKNYFLLDVTAPQIIKICKKKNYPIALRISKYEHHAGFLNYKKIHKWLWIDTFDKQIPLTLKDIKKLKQFGHKLCLVSPELGDSSVSLIGFIKSYKRQISYLDAVCTKKPNVWMKF